MGQTLLTGAVNTYVAILGPPESAASRIAIMGICSKTFYAAASLMLALFMDLANVHIEDTILPFYIISGVLVVMGVLYYFAPLPEIKAIGEEDDNELCGIILCLFKNKHISVPSSAFGCYCNIL